MYWCLQSLKLTSAPVFLHVPPRGAPKWKSMSTSAPGGKGGEAGSILVGPDVFDLAHQGFQAEVIAKWVSERTEQHVRTIAASCAFSLFGCMCSLVYVYVCACEQVRVFRPPNYVGMLALGVLIALVLALLYVKRSSLDFLYNRTAWALMAIVRSPLVLLLILVLLLLPSSCAHTLTLALADLLLACARAYRRSSWRCSRGRCGTTSAARR